ncbi:MULTISPECIES: hypothetical protein [unclassified Bacillus (in: firmicutes)]|uniref:hypothetical protein n=1 Tax=unclassified Bacillus (in: firmicutes) TaxID=185979 RepID=UPI0008EB1BCB|nr:MULTISPECIES: hypothetical protein [unclassified Bacillus (in: firmicutes)]SFB20049.1 Exonuclease III [Bacillus sp. UNCCL13]SFQ90808.1 Exonuclease III [Bacillus sp. cl95]
MKIISWNCNRNKYEKITDLSPDIAVIQEYPDPSIFKAAFEYDDVIWFGKEKGIGLGILSFSKDYKLTLLETDIKYEWIVPIKVTGKADFTLIAVWTKRIPGYASYGKLLYTALEEYESYLSGRRVVIIGDFNIDKKLPRSYSGIQGSLGFDRIIDLFAKYELESCYHYFSKEEFGAESRATYHHHGKRENPFHIEYCFVSAGILQGIQKFYIGEESEWAGFSSHFPLVIECDIEQNDIEPVAKKEITIENLKTDYDLLIDNEVATEQEIDEAVKYIRALRIMKNL